MKFKQNKLIVLRFFILIIFLSSCAPGNERYFEDPAGFWAGLWHGIICMFTFIISLFSDSVRMYEVNNIGNWYDFGFLLGVGFFFTNIWHGSKRKKK